jgi:uncharacterized protein with ATP-grasp and redox domains
MKTNLECIPCFLRQSLEAARMVTTDTDVHETIMKEVMQYLQTISYEKSPPEISREVHNLIRMHADTPDPYKQSKIQSNTAAEKLYPSLKQRVDQAEEPLLTAITLAIVGNVIDFGTSNRFLVEDMVNKPLDDAFSKRTYPLFQKSLRKASTILYLADNAGEVFFDKLLIEELFKQKKDIIYAVKANPIINDATLEDAHYAGIDKYAKIIEADKGQPMSTPGVLLPYASNEFMDLFTTVDLVISKGQGNYESLNEQTREIFFLLTVKCPLVAEDVGATLASLVFGVNR